MHFLIFPGSWCNSLKWRQSPDPIRRIYESPFLRDLPHFPMLWHIVSMQTINWKFFQQYILKPTLGLWMNVTLDLRNHHNKTPLANKSPWWEIASHSKEWQCLGSWIRISSPSASMCENSHISNTGPRGQLYQSLKGQISRSNDNFVVGSCSF